ncbi:MAG: protein phosphatase 2C domain-containing protein [Desulfobacterales bacterium]
MCNIGQLTTIDIKNFDNESLGFIIMVVIESAGVTDIGRRRKDNEDSFLLDNDLGLYVVADGMGGHLAGEVASKLVVDTIWDYMKRFKEDEDAEELEDFEKTLSKEANRLLSGIKLANQGVYQAAQNNESYRGMGSTLSAVYFTDETFIVANVGDSPIYLVHDGRIELISVIHNVMAEQASIDPNEAELLGEKFKHMLTRAIGVEEEVETDICENQYFKGDILAISSDGLSDKVSPDEILDVVRNERPAKACQTLVDLANERGGDDNITVIVLKVKNNKNEKGGIMGTISRIIYSLKKIFY